MKTSDRLRAAEEFFHARIPLTRTMGVRVVPDQEHAFALEAPVALNSNHLQTAFGGSIAAVATLAGYGFLWLELGGDSAAHVLVRESTIRYLRPVRETIRAVCVRPVAEEIERFRATLQAKGKARVTLHVRVEENGAIAAELDGTFVAVQAAAAA
jgi:thioesterase domain-containing protein